MPEGTKKFHAVNDLRVFGMRGACAVLALSGALAALGPGQAVAGDKEIAVLEALLAPGALDLGLFDAAFLKAVPPDQIEHGIDPLKAKIGPVVGIEPRGGSSYAIETATYEIDAAITLDADGRIAGLNFRAPIVKAASIDDVLKEIAAIAPQHAYLALKDGAPLYADHPEMALAVGSAFKLGILKVLSDDIDAGARKWSDVVTLGPDTRSLPSGFLGTWPLGSPVTLHTLAALMISISDNTAADTLLKLVGRGRVEAALRIEPVLSTRELFVLKANDDLRAKYVAADLEGKRAALAEADALPLPDAGKVQTVYDAGVEWELAPRKLCALIAAVAGLDVMQINPGVANSADWQSVAYKGGSETGVLSFTTAMTGKDGAHWCVSAVWNAPAAIDEQAAGTAYAGLLAKLAQQQPTSP